MTKPDHFFGATDTGRQRNNNEDAFIAQALADNRILACVIDGVGGYEGGEVAAAITKDTILENFRRSAADLSLKMKASLVQANQKIYEDRLQNPDRNNMACVVTLTIADMEQSQFHYAHVGDTRLYLYRDRSLVKVTRDHSFVGFLEDNKRISEEEAMNHPKRNEINKALGYDPNMAGVADYIETGASPFLPGDLLLLCSDGLTDLVDHKTISSILNNSTPLNEKTRLLIDAANDAGGKDNITVVLVHNHKKASKQKATRPVLIKKNEQAPKQVEIKKTPVMHKPEKKKGKGLIVFLLLLCILLAAAVYFLWQRNIKKPEPLNTVTQAVKRNASEQRLLDSLEVSPFIFLDSSYGKAITISDLVLVQKDSLYINGNGLTLSSDSAYNGPLFVTPPSCNYILLENLVIEGFTIGLTTYSKVVKLKNVRFINCNIPVQYNTSLPLNRSLSGTITDSLLFKPDSTSKNR